MNEVDKDLSERYRAVARKSWVNPKRNNILAGRMDIEHVISRHHGGTQFPGTAQFGAVYGAAQQLL